LNNHREGSWKQAFGYKSMLNDLLCSHHKQLKRAFAKFISWSLAFGVDIFSPVCILTRWQDALPSARVDRQVCWSLTQLH